MQPYQPVRRIIHVDMDAFYAAVEVLDHPELKGKPLIIGSPPNERGVVSTASYEARKFGVHSAMPSRTAAGKCPGAVFLPVRLKRYREVSRQVMQLFERYTPEVEPLSIDEAFLDIQGVLWFWKSPEQVGQEIQAAIQNELLLSASIGIATNKFLAKLCSDLNKPAGCTTAPSDPEEIADFLAPLPAGHIWGVGEKTLTVLQSIGIRRIGDIQQSNPRILNAAVGPAAAEHIRQLAFGRDDREVVRPGRAKSISGETTFSRDETHPEHIRCSLIQQVERVSLQLRESGMLASTAVIKIRFAPFDTITRQLPLHPPLNGDIGLIEAASCLLESISFHRPVRLVGFGVTGLVEPGHAIQGSLFEPEPGRNPNRKDSEIDRAADEIRKKFGPTSLRHASAIRLRERTKKRTH